MQVIDTLIHARWIVPVEPEGRVLEHHSLAIDRGRIVAVLDRRDVDTRYQPKETIDLPDHVLIPGLVNAHTHAAMSLFRGMADDLPLMDWLQNHMWPAEAKVGQPRIRARRQRARHRRDAEIRHHLLQRYVFFPDATARAVQTAGIRACIGLILIDFPSAWAGNADEYLHKGLQLHDALKHSPLITTAFAPHAPYTVADAPLEKVRMYADELDVPIHMHVHETAHEVQQAVAQSGKRPLARLAELGLLGPRLLAVHMTQLIDDEINTLARANVNVIHCPESNLKLASGTCPVPKLLKAGVNVALGTDGAASNNDLDMLGELRTAALLAKGASFDPTVVPAHTALRLATLNGAPGSRPPRPISVRSRRASRRISPPSTCRRYPPSRCTTRCRRSSTAPRATR